LTEYKREWESVDVEEWKQGDAQVLFGWVMLAREAHSAVWLIPVNHINIRVSPDSDHKLIVLVLYNAASIHAFKVPLV
jgi:hypothetical protein